MKLEILKDPVQREKLDPRDKAYFVGITDNIHLGYKKGKSISRWVIRLRANKRYKSHTIANVIPDDIISSNGENVLSFEQAREWALEMSETLKNLGYVPKCSFCYKPQHEVQYLVAGSSSFICNLCIEVCNEIIKNKLLLSESQAEKAV